MNPRIRKLLCSVLVAFSSTGHATGWTGKFTITSLYISGADNLHLRVSGFSAVSACPTGPTWAYINQSASGAKTYIAALMAAYATGKPVDIYWDTDAQGYCRIVEVMY